ncbi:MAG: hypothetical protein QM736_10565 [Vicinamibacterales bacterium]
MEIRLLVDGTVAQIIRTEVLNAGAGNLSNAWHLHSMQPMAAGTHDIHVDVRVLSTTGLVQVNTPYAGRLSAVLMR